MPIDASIYNNLNQQPYNPLDTVEKLTSINNALAQNRLLALNQKYSEGKNYLQQGQINTGKYIAASTDPETGLFDNTKFNVFLSHDGASSNFVYGGGTPLVNERIKPTAYFDPATKTPMQQPNQLYDYAHNAVRPQNGLGQPNGQPQQSLPALSQDDIDKTHDNLMDLQNTTADLLKKPNVGVSDVIDALSGPKGLISKGLLNPAEAAKIYGDMPAGQNGQDPTSDQIKGWMQGHMNDLNQKSLQFTQAYGPPSSVQKISQQTQQSNQNNQTQGAGATSNQLPSSINPNASVPTGTPLPYNDALKKAQDESQQIRVESNKARESIAPVQNILDLVNTGLKTGPTTKFRNDVDTVLAGLGFKNDKSTNDTTRYQEFLKYVNANSIAGDPRTDQALNTFKNASISDKTLGPAIKELANFALATAHLKIGRENSMNQNSGVGTQFDPDKFNKWNSNFNQISDVRAAKFNLLPPSEKVDYLKNLPEDELPKVINSYRQLKSAHAFP